jgi:Xaa-Pro aminopeptidase
MAMKQEYVRRLTAVRQAASTRGIDGLVTFTPSTICYLTGFNTANLWDFQCLIVLAADEPKLVIREFERDRFKLTCLLDRPVTYPPEGNAIDRLLDTLPAQGRLGIDMSRYLDAKTFDELCKRLPAVRWVDASDLVNAIRVVKSSVEIACLRRAAEITCKGMRAGIAAVREGALDYEIVAEASHTMFGSGSEAMCIQPIVAAGVLSGVAHSSANGVRVTNGDPVFLELGACIERYTAPLMRTAFVGTPLAELRELAEYSSRALDAIIRTIRPGVQASAVAAAGRAQLEPVLNRISFHFVWGYSVGLGFPPSWLEESDFLLQSNNPRELRPGMVFHLPMMLRVGGLYGAGHSETVLVTEHGAEILTPLER